MPTANQLRAALDERLPPTARVSRVAHVWRSSFPVALYWVGGAASCAWMLVFVVARAAQPFPLDAFEEFQIVRAIEWNAGGSLYPAAESAVFPDVYPPLYYCCLAPWLRVFGESLPAARALSLVAMIAIVGAGCWSLRDSPARAAATLAFVAALFGFHATTGRWFEIAKPDALVAALVVMAVAAGEHRTWREALVSGASLLLAALAKQNAPLFVLPLCLAHTLSGRWRWAIGWGAGVLAAIVGSYWSLDRATGGRFFYWVFAWTASHGIDVERGIGRTAEVLAERGVMLAMAVSAGLLWRPRCRWTWSLLAAIGVAVIGMSKHGGLENHLLPSAAIGAIVIGRWAGAAWSRDGDARDRVALWRWGVIAALAIVIVQGLPRAREFHWLATRRAETDDWVRAVRRLDGRVAVSHHALLARRAGADCVFSDLILRFPGLVVAKPVADAISNERFDYLILAADPATCVTPGWSELIAAHYSPAGELQFENRSGVLPRRFYAARRLNATE